VVDNDKFPERVGREILKNIKARAAQQNLWQGQFYIEKLGEYKRVERSLSESDEIYITGKVGFFNRTVEWCARIKFRHASLDKCPGAN